MDRERLLGEHKATLESLEEKTRFVYSEAFYALDDSEKQMYMKDKMATEGHLNTLSNLLWSKAPQFGGISDFFALGIISSMFGSSFGCGNTKPQTYAMPVSTESES